MIGKIILQLREKAKVTQAMLTRGITSIHELSKIESIRSIPNKFLSDALIQRLGKSADKIEMVLSDQEYELYFLRTLIESELLAKEYDSSDERLIEYKKLKGCDTPIQMQYIKKMETIAAYLRHGDNAESLTGFIRALEITFLEWKEGDIKNYYLCTQELQILILIGCMYAKNNDIIKAIEIEKMVLEYVDERYTDSEEIAKIYPHCSYLLAQYYSLKNEWDQVEMVCQKAMSCLIENGVLSFLHEIMGFLIECLNRSLKKEEEQKLIKQKNALDFVYQMVAPKIKTAEIIKLIVTSIQCEIILSNEMIRDVRIAQGMSQEEFGMVNETSNKDIKVVHGTII